MVRSSLLLGLLLTASACGNAVLGTPPLELPGSSGSLAWEDPFPSFPFDRSTFGSAVHPILTRDGCANAGCHAAEEAQGEGLWIHRGVEETSPLVDQDLASVLRFVTLEGSAVQTRLIYHPVASSRSHAGRTPWWGVSSSDGAPYAPIVDWIEQARETASCFESAFELTESEGPEAAVSAAQSCSPAAIESCWPDC